MSRQMEGCAVGGGRESGRGRKELMEIIADAMKQGILRRRKGERGPREWIRHGRASKHASGLPR